MAVSSIAMAADLIPPRMTYTKVFYSQTDQAGWKAGICGRIDSFSVRQDIDKNDLMERPREKSRVTVRLYSREGIKEGDELFVIDDKNLITGRIKVVSIFKSLSFGYMLTGYGNFRLCARHDRVVQRYTERDSDAAGVYKGRGDYFQEKGDPGSAIAQYKKALTLDRGNPEVHLALGTIYLKQGVLQFANREFIEAYRTMGRLYDNEDRYRLLRGLADVRYREVYESYLPQEKKEKLKEQGIGYCREALAIYPQSVEINYFLGRFHYSRSSSPESDDKTARDYFIKVVELQPEHINANIALSELYFRHKNREKAQFYANQALKGDPHNRRAHQLLNYIDKFNK